MLGKSELKEVDENRHVSARPRPIFFSPSVFVPPKHEFQKHEPPARRLCLVLGGIEGDK
jgi:hypothetical protein